MQCSTMLKHPNPLCVPGILWIILLIIVHFGSKLFNPIWTRPWLHFLFSDPRYGLGVFPPIPFILHFSRPHPSFKRILPLCIPPLQTRVSLSAFVKTARKFCYVILVTKRQCLCQETSEQSFSCLSALSKAVLGKDHGLWSQKILCWNLRAINF